MVSLSDNRAPAPDCTSEYKLEDPDELKKNRLGRQSDTFEEARSRSTVSLAPTVHFRLSTPTSLSDGAGRYQLQQKDTGAHSRKGGTVGEDSLPRAQDRRRGQMLATESIEC